jgi:hypothetical protein
VIAPRRLAAPLVLAVALAGCGEGPVGADEAVATFETFRDRLRAEDYAAVYDLLSDGDHRRAAERCAAFRRDAERRDEDPAAAERVTKLAELTGLSVFELTALAPRELWATGTKAMGAEMLRDLARSELAEPPKIRGDVAVLLVRPPGRPQAVIHLVREEGSWRVSLRKPSELDR